MLEGLPPDLRNLRLPTGVHRRWLKLLVFGGWKTGKSTFLASMPRPILGIDCGEGGIASYLPKDDKDVDCIGVTNPEQFESALKYALKHEGQLASVVIDPITELWTDHMDWWSKKLGRGNDEYEIRGGDWRYVKGPWKLMLRQLMRANFHVGYAAWLKEVEYSEGDAGPGVKGKLEIQKVIIPAMERTVGYTVDLVFQTDLVRDAFEQPTSGHIVRFWGGRRPLSVSPEDLHVGKVWKFNARKPVSVWDTVMGPFLEKWDDGATENLGILDVGKAEVTKGLKDLEEVAEDAEVGRLIRLISEQTDPAVYRAQVFPAEVQPALSRLTGQGLAAVRAAHEAKKLELK
jgi:hypothetical protein